MRLKKDSHKWKNILQAIDIVLAIAALVVLGYCGWLIYSINNIPDVSAMEAEIQVQQAEIAQLETRIDDRNQEIAQAEEESLVVLKAAQEALDAAQADYDAVSPEHTQLSGEIADYENLATVKEELRADIARIRTEYGQAVRKLEDMILAGESDYRICYLTLDDGPSYLTEQFLDKIDSLDIYVTFFTIGVQMQTNSYGYRDKLLQREAMSGHAIANHTYTHALEGSLYRSLDNFINAVQKQEDLVYETTGIKTDIVRFPAGSYYCPFRTSAIAELEEMGYGWIDWIGNAYDSGNNKHTSDRVAANVIWQARQDKVTVILMHDWRSETLGALETIVKTLKEENYLFLPLFKESSTVGTAKPRWDG